MAKQQGFGFQSLFIVLAVMGALASPHLKLGSGAESSGPGPEAEAKESETGNDASVELKLELKASGSKVEPYSVLTRALARLAAELEPGGTVPPEPATVDQIVQMSQRRIIPLIISVPDATQSHMALYYDQALVALREAAAHAGYVQSHFYLPWQKQGGRKNAPGPSAASTLEAQPGLMLLVRGRPKASNDSNRPKAPAESLILTILVTESPVLGASAKQLELAVQLARAIQPTGKVYLLGPFFSGTARSWAKALRAPLGQIGISGPPMAATVVTGTATATVVDDIFREARITFGRVVPRDSDLVDLVKEQLGVGAKGSRFAELTELGTLYGEVDYTETSDSSNKGDTEASPALYRFPIHISQVRAEREAAEAHQADLFPSLRRTLGLKLNPAEEHESDIPASLSALTPFSDDLMLAEELVRICDSGAKHVLVEATDPIDVIFLSQQARKFCPDLTVVTLGYDQLFIHPDLGATMAGVLVASSYAPSFESSALIGDQTQHPFPNSAIQGFYNSFLVLAKEAGVPMLPGTSPIGVRCEGVHCEHDFFFSEIAGSHYWPFKISELAHPQIDRDVWRPTSESEKDEPNRMPRSNRVRLFAWPALFAAMAHLWLRWLRHGPFKVVDESWRRVRAARLIVADLSLALIVGLTTLPLLGLIAAPSSRLRSTSLAIVVLSAFAVMALLVDAVCMACGFVLRRRLPHNNTCGSGALLQSDCALDVCAAANTDGNRQRKRCNDPIEGRACAGSPSSGEQPIAPDRRGGLNHLTSRIALLLIAVLVVAVGAAFWDVALAILHQFQGNVSTTDASAELRWFRFFGPFAISSIMPFVWLAGGTYGWAFLALLRAVRLDRFPSAHGETILRLSDLPRLKLETLCNELLVPWSTTTYWPALSVLFTFCIWRFCDRLQATLDPAGFDVGYQIAFSVLLFFFGAELARFVTLSGRLLAFLRDLAAEPMIDAYDRVAAKVSGSFGLQMSARVPKPQDFQISVLTARTLTQLAGDSPDRALETATSRLESDMVTLNAAPERVDVQRRVHDGLFVVAGTLHGMLTEGWRQRARELDLENVPEVTRKDLLPLGVHAHSPTALVLMGAIEFERYVWMRTAEDFVALRSSTFIYQVLHELRHTLVFALTASAMLAASTSCYPFQPAHFLKLCVWSAVVIVVGIGLWRMLALERDEVLSRLGGTRPDHIEWNAAFIQQMALYVLLPLTVAVLGLFPDLSEAIAAHLAPIARTLPSPN